MHKYICFARVADCTRVHAISRKRGADRTCDRAVNDLVRKGGADCARDRARTELFLREKRCLGPCGTIRTVWRN
eukprot:11224114-Lingulodinium_polyedra.AAC.1